MAIQRDAVKAVIFDYGNTLIEFVAHHAQHCLDALIIGLEERFGPVDRAVAKAMCERIRLKPYQGEYRENDVHAVTNALVRTLYRRTPDAAELDDLLRIREQAFVEVIDAPDYVHDFLARMKQRYRLALVSNYPNGDALRASLARTGIDRFLEVVVVSGDVGHVKPHPLVFQTALDQLGLEPHEVLYIGDNWLGDIQGARNLGMQAVWICQYDTLEVFERQPGDHDANLVIDHLLELERHL